MFRSRALTATPGDVLHQERRPLDPPTPGPPGGVGNSTVAVMDWMREMTERWLRIIGAAGDDRTPLEEAVRQLAALGGQSRDPGRSRLLRRRPAAAQETPLVTALSRQLLAGVAVSDLLVGRLCALTGQSRDQVLAGLAESPAAELREQQWRTLRAELSGSSALLADTAGHASYSGLGARIEELLRLAQEQAASLIDAARAEAAAITAAAARQSPPDRDGRDGRDG